MTKQTVCPKCGGLLPLKFRIDGVERQWYPRDAKRCPEPVKHGKEQPCQDQ